MHPAENAVREAAAALHSAIIDARAAGFRVDYPTLVEGLLSIAVSETSKFKASEPKDKQPTKKS